VTHADGTVARSLHGTRDAAQPRVTINSGLERPQGPPFAIPHEAVCLHCGHGESLHPQRDLACLLCDQRASVGLLSRFCVGFLSDRFEREAALA
jgi:hypothetical protein